MPIIFETSHVDEVAYTKLITRQVFINLGIKEGREFLAKWDIIVYPLEASVDFVDFFDHTEGETSSGIAWGITMPTGSHSTNGGTVRAFVNDIKSMFIIRSNFVKISHEMGHALTRYRLGSTRCIRQFNEPGARAGTEGPCYVTKVHDQYYGRKQFRTYWIRYGFIWLPVKLLDVYSILH